MTTTEPANSHTCQVCGAAEEAEECTSCYGTGVDRAAVGDDRRYQVMPCWVCCGAGIVYTCPNWYDQAHQDAHERALQHSAAHADTEEETR